MSMKKYLHLFLASAAMAMLGCEYPAGHHVKKKLAKGESKKCKSCKSYDHCKYYYNVAPMRTACDKYERRKKK